MKKSHSITPLTTHTKLSHAANYQVGGTLNIFNIMKVEILIDESVILSTVRYCIMVGIKPTINNVKKEIRAMVTKYGECWTIEPTFDDIEGVVVDWESANKQSEIIAPKYYDKIY